MKTIIYAHPWDGSFNQAILETITASLTEEKEMYHLINLYKDQFDPVYSPEELKQFSKGDTLYQLVKSYQKMIKESSELIFVFPIWWFGLPGILKGFLDKVLLKNFAYSEDQAGNWTGLLTNIVKVTAITTAVMDKETLIEHGDAVQGVFLQGTLGYLGIPKEAMSWAHFSEVTRSTENERKTFLDSLPSLI